MDYKNTLNLPKTDFPMKAQLAQKEPDILAQWSEDKIYERLLEKNKDKPTFILHDGPPYANGHIHFGHILNKILKDIIIKFKNMEGFRSPYVPGWDCHGLPIELGAVKELSEKHKKPGASFNPLERRAACREYAQRFVQAQSNQFQRLGVFGDWENPYLTLQFQYEADIANEFAKLYNQGYVFQGKKPVYWCCSCGTALAEAEVEYEEKTSPSIYVRFPLIQLKELGLSDYKDVSIVIWTTTPWTLPANMALAIGEQYEYVALKVGDQVYIVARDLEESFLDAIEAEGEIEELEVYLGSDLASMKLQAEHPFLKRQVPVIAGEHVTLESGTGVVHTAPGHGLDDYILGQAHNLEVYCPVDDQGKMISGSMSESRFEELKAIEGVFVEGANKIILESLHQHKILLSDPGLNIKHSYPHCWRCKKAVIFRATHQWFCSLEHEDLRKKSLRAINGDVQWIPSWGHDRIYGMIENRPDWCLSRQRIWGVPIIIHHCQDCEKPLLNAEIADYIVKAFSDGGADVWWKSDEALLPPNTTCSCGSSKFKKDQSILDVWFDSGVSYAAVLESNPQLKFPADLYLEGSDQHRGWFHSSLLTSMATRQVAPYKAALTHGFVVDGKGKKYSKSAQNYVPPENLINQMGAELLRMWVAAEDYRNDIRVSNEIMKVLSEIYRKIRNTCRFMLGNLYDFDASEHYVNFDQRTEIDRNALSTLHRVITKIKKAYNQYEFHVVLHTLNKFFTVEFSATYLDILKDRLYCDKANGFLRRSAQSTLYDAIKTLVPLMAPIFSFTAEELWKYVPQQPEDVSSVFLADWPEDHDEWKNKELEASWDRIWKIRDEVLKTLEDARKKKEIGHPLDAKVILSAKDETLHFLKKYADDWTQIFITSQVEIRDEVEGYHLESEMVPTLKVSVVKAEGAKCERCWNYSTDVGANSEHATLCPRCVKAV